MELAFRSSVLAAVLTDQAILAQTMTLTGKDPPDLEGAGMSIQELSPTLLEKSRSLGSDTFSAGPMSLDRETVEHIQSPCITSSELTASVARRMRNLDGAHRTTAIDP